MSTRPIALRAARRVAGSLVLPALGAAFALLSPAARAGGLLIADGGLGGVLEIVQHDVRVTINNGVAVTDVEQVFRNTEDRPVEALYTFPVPNAASVSDFSMWIDGKEMVGEVVEKRRAREIYESYKRKNVDPGLLEQVDYKTFEMRIFPIAARAEQRVKVTYCQELDVDHDQATYVYPLATTSRPGVDARVSGRFSFALDVRSAVPVVAMESPSHRAATAVVAHDTSYWQASLEAVGGDLSRDVVVTYSLKRPKTGFDVITSRVPGEDGCLLFTLTVGEELAQENPGMDYVFVTDVSGSMNNDGKLGLSQRAVEAFLETLGDEDRLELIAFNVAANPLFSALAAPDVVALTRARDSLGAQVARGGTRLRPAVEAAYRYRDPDRPLNVVVLSDGMTEQGEQRELLDVIRARPSGVRVFCVGVGNEVNRPLLRQLANDAGGLAAFISHGDDFERQAKGFRRKLVRPAATEVQVTFAGGDVYDVEPQVLPNLFHGSPLRLYARYREPGASQVTLRANVMGHPLEQTFAIDLPERDDQNPEIERMWAFRRIERLMDENRASGDDPRRIEEIVRLGEGYSIVSEHTSFLVLENDREYERWAIARRNATRVRDRAARAALQDELERLRRQAEARVGPPTGEAAGSPADVVQAAPASSSAPARPGTPPPAAPRRDNSRDVLPRSGGGAIDPLTGLAALGLGALYARRRRRDDEP